MTQRKTTIQRDYQQFIGETMGNRGTKAMRWISGAVLTAILVITPQVVLCKPASGSSRLMEAALEQDSTAWVSHTYDKNSARNVHMMDTTAGPRLYADYTFNNGEKGWVQAQVSGGAIQCLEYWNSFGCSPVRGGVDNNYAPSYSERRAKERADCWKRMGLAGQNYCDL